MSFAPAGTQPARRDRRAKPGRVQAAGASGATAGANRHTLARDPTGGYPPPARQPAQPGRDERHRQRSPRRGHSRSPLAHKLEIFRSAARSAEDVLVYFWENKKKKKYVGGCRVIEEER